MNRKDFFKIICLMSWCGLPLTPHLSFGADNPLSSRTESIQFGNYYHPVPGDIPAKIAPFKLPLNTSEIVNWDYVLKQQMPELAPVSDVIVRQGFGAIRTANYDDFAATYKTLQNRDIPLFITTDSLLHLYHIFFDETLRTIEEQFFSNDLLQLLSSLKVHIAGQKTDSSAEINSASQLALQYIDLLGLCLDPEFISSPSSAVSKELQLIESHQGFANSPLFSYSEDYSQYVPRGHYTQSERLKRYFKAMMAAGRYTFLIHGGEPFGPAASFLVPEATARMQTIAAVMLSEALAGSKLTDGRSCKDVWNKIYQVTSFYSGLADDLSPSDYFDAASAFEKQPLSSNLKEKSNCEKFKQTINRLKKPAIFSGTGDAGTASTQSQSGRPAPEDLDQTLVKTAGMRFMGQRFIPDSYFMGRLVFPVVGGEPQVNKPFTAEQTLQGLRKCWPRGLDVMALLGHSRSDFWLQQLHDDAYDGYADERKRLANELAGLSDRDWNRNAYWAWLRILSQMGIPAPQGYQTFQQQPTWADKNLNTALASWSQLRHDTILYAKQSYTMRAMSAAPRRPRNVPGYIEPAPLVYAGLISITSMTSEALQHFELMPQEMKDRFSRLQSLLQRVLDICRMELENQPLTAQDTDFIQKFGSELSNVVEIPASVEKTSNLNQPATSFSPEKRTTLVADVHTDGNSRQVLEEATGYLDLMVVCIRHPDGSLGLSIGPVFSHYEFKHPMQDRLTDEAWREMLSGRTPLRSEWVRSYVCEPQP